MANSNWQNYYGVIYKINDTATDKVYIGQTIRSLRKRFKDHLNYPNNKFLRRAFETYNYELRIQKIPASKECISTTKGEFKMMVIRKCENLKELNEAEKEEIKNHKSCVKDYHSIINGKIIPLYGYNIDRGGRGTFPSYGPDHPLYLQIKEEPLIELIRKGFFRSEIANEFTVSGTTISRRIYDSWHKEGIKNLEDARKYFGGSELYDLRKNKKIQNAHHMKRILIYYTKIDRILLRGLLNEGLTADEIDDVFLTKLIHKGYVASEIGKKVGLIDSKWMAKRFQHVLDMNFQEARDEYFFRPRIVYLLKNGVKSPQLTDFFNKDYKDLKVPIKKFCRKGIYNAMRRIWQRIYDEFEQRSREEGRWDPCRSPLEKNRLQFTHFYRYLIRIFSLYPKINKELAELLIDSDLSTKEIDQEFLLYLVQTGNSLEEMVNKYKSAYDPFRKWFKKVIGMNYNKAKDQFFWKHKILHLIKKYDPPHAINKIAIKLKASEHTIRTVVRRIWNKELKKMGGIKSLLEYLKNKDFYNKLNKLVKLFGVKADRLKKYVLTSKHVLQGLFNLTKTNPFFTARSMAKELKFNERTSYYHIINKLIPFGLVEKLHLKYKLTNLGKNFLRKLFI